MEDRDSDFVGPPEPRDSPEFGGRDINHRHRHSEPRFNDRGDASVSSRRSLKASAIHQQDSTESDILSEYIQIETDVSWGRELPVTERIGLRVSTDGQLSINYTRLAKNAFPVFADTDGHVGADFGIVSVSTNLSKLPNLRVSAGFKVAEASIAISGGPAVGAFASEVAQRTSDIFERIVVTLGAASGIDLQNRRVLPYGRWY